MEPMSDPRTEPPSRPTPAAERAEEFLRRVFPGEESQEPAAPASQVRGVDDTTQARLEVMGDQDRESW
jgi:hypothetical protein